MLEIFEYEFMQRAFIVGTLIGIILPCIGLPMLLKRLAMIGDSLSHASLAGVTIGLSFGINPMVSAIVACVFAGFSIEAIRYRLKAYQEVSTVIILALGVGVAGLFSGFSGNGNAISSYLFGSIITINDGEFLVIVATALGVLLVYYVWFKQIFLVVFNPMSARLLGINVKVVNFVITILSAVAIALSAKAIGSLIVSSLLVIPVMTAMQYTKTYKKTLILSIVISLVCIYAGLLVSYYLNLKSGSVIVVLAVIGLMVSLLMKKK
ncbi:metal ABC transporter permease [Carnobacteriaceae bacterium zg-ZUI240]|nr:metal ABC transporter permease [Carnobacteriaceae bacterium zg-ZUI240]